MLKTLKPSSEMPKQIGFRRESYRELFDYTPHISKKNYKKNHMKIKYANTGR
jgi:hypothetical protein